MAYENIATNVHVLNARQILKLQHFVRLFICQTLRLHFAAGVVVVVTGLVVVVGCLVGA